MWFTRVWIVLTSALVAILLGAALLAPKPSSRELGNLHGNRLDLVQHNAELRLQLTTRELIDSTWSFAQDSELVDVLEQASARQKSFVELQQRAETIMRAMLQRYGSSARRPSLFIAVDYRGKQIARLGAGEKKFKAGRDGLAGYPLVGAALKGLLRDDTWSYNGQLFLMAGVPVIARARNRYIGALLMGVQIEKGFAKRFKKQLIPDAPHLPRSEVAFFLRGQMLSSTVSSQAFATLPQRFTRQRETLLKHGRSAAFRLEGKDGKSYFVVIAPLAGSALAHDAFYALAIHAPRPPSLLGIISKLDAKRDLTLTLWLLVGGLFLALTIVGMVLLRQEHGAPIKRLELALSRVLKGDASRLDEFKYGAALQPSAKSINELIDKGSKRAGATTALSSRTGAETVDRLLDNTIADTRIDNVAFNGGMPPLADDGPPSMGVMQSAGVETSAHHIDRIPAPAEGVTPLVALSSAEEAPTELAAPAPFSLDNPPLASDDHLPSLTPMALPDHDAPMLGGPPIGAPIELPPVGGDEPQRLEVQVTSQSLSNDPQAAYFREIYEEFLSIKRTCGESIDNITYERFAKKLRKNRDGLIARYKCEDVKFRVYIKDGKAALKATPVTD